MNRSGLTRGTRWCQACSPSLSNLEVIHEKTLPQKTIFLSLVTSPTYSIRLTANLRAQIDSGDPGLSFGCLTILLASIVIKIIAIFCETSPILRKFALFWPPVTSNLTWSKNDQSIFCRTCHGLSNTVYRLSLAFLVFEFSGGGRSSAPPPAVRRWLRPEYGMDRVETIQSSPNPRATDPNPVQSSWWTRIWIQSSPIRTQQSRYLPNTL